jgi:hypothetical protein
MARLTSLYRLDQVDDSLQAARLRLEEIDRLLAEDQQVEAARQVFEHAQEGYVSARSAAGEAEQGVAAQQDKIEKTDQSLYDGSVTNPKELAELQQEAESLRRFMEALEDRLLEAMVATDEAEQVYEQAKAELERTTDEVAEQNVDLRDERDQLLHSVERIEAERQAALSNVEVSDLKTYEKVRSKVGRNAVAVLDSVGCGVCGMALPASKLQVVRQGDELTRCAQCGRILYAG